MCLGKGEENTGDDERNTSFHFFILKGKDMTTIVHLGVLYLHTPTHAHAHTYSISPCVILTKFDGLIMVYVI